MEKSAAEVSEWNKKAQEHVQYLLSKVNNEDFLDEFAQSFLQAIDTSVITSISSATSTHAKRVLRENL